MKLVLRREAATLFGAVLFATMSAGCTEETTGLYIRGNVVIDPPECLARPEGSTTLRSLGRLDVGVTDGGYVASLIVASQLAPRGDKTNLRTETMVATITGSEVRLYNDIGELETDPFTVPATGLISPESSDSPGFGIVTTTLIPAATAQTIADGLTSRYEVRTLVSEVVVFGKTIGGLDIESAVFTYVIQVCEGCSVEFPADSIVTSLEGVPSCGPTEPPDVPPCRLGQDDRVDCRMCNGSGNPYCVYPGEIEP